MQIFLKGGVLHLHNISLSFKRDVYRCSFQDKMRTLKSLAKTRGLLEQWELIVTPWLEQIDTNIVKAIYISETSAGTFSDEVCFTFDHEPAGEPSGGPLSDEAPPQKVSGGSSSDSIMPAVPSAPIPARQVIVKDLVVGLNDDDVPWQHKKYSSDNAVWQGAALRRRMHPRRTNKSLGTCSVDLSGPHEPTPRPGDHVKKNPCRYFLALTVHPDLTAQRCGMAVQVSETVQTCECAQPARPELGSTLIYAALLGTKCEAPVAIKHLLAQINNDHANFPTELIFR